MSRTQTIILLVAVFVALILGAVCVFFPFTKDAWFAMDQQRLLQVPPGRVVLRPTHFSDNPGKIVVYAAYQNNDREVRWIMGRNLPLRVAFATAYDVNRANVLLPPDAPTNNFDFLVTTLDPPKEHLKVALLHKLGLVAQRETQDTDVLAIKIMNPSLPGLTVSDPGRKANAHFNQGKIYFTHVRIRALTDFFERTLEIPVVDKSGLTNFYNFSMAWDPQTRNLLRSEATSRAAMDNIFNSWGLTLQPDTASVDMLVVKHQN
jgi:uncharacterized protein (TIGR03435 family)